MTESQNRAEYCTPTLPQVASGMDYVKLDAKRFIARLQLDGDCWLWTGFVDPAGYARTAIGGERMGAHEAAFRLFVGPVPDGLEIDHVRTRCHANPLTRRRCCNPAHLEAVTRQENMRRIRVDRDAIRSWNSERCVNGHEWTADNTYVEPNQTRRRCRRCYQTGTQVRRANRKAAAANTRIESVDALADATALHLRMLGRWQPGTVDALLSPANLPSSSRLEQLLGGGL